MCGAGRLTGQLEGGQGVADALRVQRPSEGEGPRREGERVEALVSWNIAEHSTEKLKQPNFRIPATKSYLCADDDTDRPFLAERMERLAKRKVQLSKDYLQKEWRLYDLVACHHSKARTSKLHPAPAARGHPSLPASPSCRHV